MGGSAERDPRLKSSNTNSSAPLERLECREKRSSWLQRIPGVELQLEMMVVVLDEIRILAVSERWQQLSGMKWLHQMPLSLQITLGIVFHIAVAVVIGTVGAAIWFAIRHFMRLLGAS